MWLFFVGSCVSSGAFFGVALALCKGRNLSYREPLYGIEVWNPTTEAWEPYAAAPTYLTRRLAVRWIQQINQAHPGLQLRMRKR
jgi:hypothetical protein